MNETWIQVIAIIGSNLVIMLTFFGVSISLHNGIREEIRGMQIEMKEFHGKLERQDAEFRGIMARQDAEFRGIMSKQDAEFKAHLIYGHKEEK